MYNHYAQGERASGGSSIAVYNNYIHNQINLKTNFQAVAVRLSLNKMITLCSIYIPPNIIDHLNRFRQVYIYCFPFRSRIFHLYRDAGEGQQNLGLCSAFRAFEEGGIFIVSHRLVYRQLHHDTIRITIQ
jgi:hypothetical protein